MAVNSRFSRCAGILLAGLSAAAIAEPSFVPVYKHNFPDPFVIAAGNHLSLCATRYKFADAHVARPDRWAPIGDRTIGKRLDGMRRSLPGARGHTGRRK